MPEAGPGLGGVILAAGASERMGEPKALLRLPAPSRTCLLIDQVHRLQRAGCARVAVVLGADAARITPALPPGDPNVLVCLNEGWRRGSFSSLQVGLKTLPDCARGALVLPVDVPGVPPQVMAGLVPGSDDVPDAVVPVHEGRGGHPVWLSPALIARILREPPTARLDHLLAGCVVVRVEVADPHVRGNVNTPEDWARFVSEPEA
jgi:CTP:molybdopterin cytidylyltransferase MocA